MNVNIGCYSSGVSKTDRGGTLKRLLLHTTPRLKESGKALPKIAFGDYLTQGLPSSLLHSGLCSKSLPHSPHTPLGQIRNNPPILAELLHIGRSLFASQFSVRTKSQVSHAALLWTLRAHRGTFAFLRFYFPLTAEY